MMKFNLEQIAQDFEETRRSEPEAMQLAEVYRTGLMCNLDGRNHYLDNTSLDFNQGLLLWYLVRQKRPDLVVETGFGRGGSAAFLLCALAPWGGRLKSIDPAFRQWAGEVGSTYLKSLGVADRHTLVERRSESVLAEMLEQQPKTVLKLSYIDGSHHFDGTLFDFMYLDRMTEIGGLIAIDDAHSPAVRTVASFVAHNLSYRLYYPFPRLVICEKLADDTRDWCHFKPFVSSKRQDWDVHEDRPDQDTVPGAVFSES